MDYQSLFIGLPALVGGAGMLLFPRARRLAAEARLARRKSQLADGEPERFFEERRTLDAYPLPATDGRWRAKGAFFTVCGAALIVMSYYR